MKRIVILLMLIPTLSHAQRRQFAPAFPPVTEGASVVRFAFVDSGVFFRDNANSNALVDLHRAPGRTTLELWRARGKGPPRDGENLGTRLEDGLPAFTRVVPTDLLARVTLEPTGPDSSVYVVTDVACTDPKLVFVKGGTVNMAGETPGFDLGSRNVIEVRETPGADRHRALTYVEAFVPPPSCEANAS